MKLAAQLFSNTTANAIRRCYSLGLELYKPTETADFIQLLNDWFDVMNSTMDTFGYPGKVFHNTVFIIELLSNTFLTKGTLWNGPFEPIRRFGSGKRIYVEAYNSQKERAGTFPERHSHVQQSISNAF